MTRECDFCSHEIDGWTRTMDLLPKPEGCQFYLIRVISPPDGVPIYTVALYSAGPGFSIWETRDGLVDNWIEINAQMVTHWMPLPEPPEEHDIQH